MQSHSWDGHLALVPYSERERRAGVAAWVRRGLELGAKILYIEPADAPAERSVMSVLRDDEIDADDAAGRGQLQVLPADGQTYSATFQTTVTDDALAVGYPTVRWSGEAETAWGVMSRSEHADVEWATDELCHTRPVSILCQYSPGLGQATLQTVCAMHGGGVRDSQLHTFPIRGGVALAGEVDVSNETVLSSALMAAGSAPGVGRGPFIVDLRRLAFLDVTGAKAFLTATTAHRMNGGTVLLQDAAPQVARILRLLGVDLAPGCSMTGKR